MSLLKKYAGLITFSHSVFALPYALVAFVVAVRKGALIELNLGLVGSLVVMVLAVVFARTSAMAFNRIADRKIDAKNPRTASRELVTGEVSFREALLLCVVSSLIFLSLTSFLGSHCFALAPFVLLWLFFYSYCKRFTSFAHLVLGISLAMAPGGAWWVVRPVIEIEPLILMLAVLFWVAGFDILYSCQDVDFDKKEKLFSIPKRFGIKNSLRISFLFHIFSFLAFLLFGLFAELSQVYSYGMLFIGMLLLGQHLLVSEKDLSRINLAFFTFNGMISICYLLLVVFS